MIFNQPQNSQDASNKKMSLLMILSIWKDGLIFTIP